MVYTDDFYNAGFQSTPPCGGDRENVTWLVDYYLFQSTPPCGGDIHYHLSINLDSISIHAPMRGRPAQRGPMASILYFNPRPHAGATSFDLFGFSRCLFQSTPPCGGDVAANFVDKNHNDFNPRPHAGATLPENGLTVIPLFQSTPPCGGDACPAKLGQNWAISIHAPMRGRLVSTRSPQMITKFQSTPPCGGDPPTGAWKSRKPDFNPRPHAGATFSPFFTKKLPINFNPRPHAGATNSLFGNFYFPDISIHAPMRGRLPRSRWFLGDRDFNPRPHAGATGASWSDGPNGSNFNPRPHAGATYIVLPGAKLTEISIHAPMRGRRALVLCDCQCQRISIHAPMRGRHTANMLAMIFGRISIHAPMRGRHSLLKCIDDFAKFQSTPPCGGDVAGKNQRIGG